VIHSERVTGAVKSTGTHANTSFLQGPDGTVNQGAADNVPVNSFAYPDAVGRSTNLIGWL
jgi:hypothetical protein